MKTLESTLSNLEQLLEDAFAEIGPRGPSADDVLRISGLSRQTGIAELFAHYDTDTYFSALYRSGEFLLLHTEAEKAGRRPVGLARSAAPVLDVLAIGATDLARRLDRSLPDAPLTDADDEDSFAWAQALQRTVLDAPSDTDLRARAAGLNALGGDALEVRAALLTALADKDLDSFEEALARLTKDWRLPIDEERGGGIVDRYLDVTEFNLFLEGVVLARLAKSRGLQIADHYPFIPAAALADPPSFPAPLDGVKPLQ